MTQATMANLIGLTGKKIDVRDIVARVEELECKSEAGSPLFEREAAERAKLNGLLLRLHVPAGDLDWRGNIYPVELIRDDYFTQYSKEMATDLGHLAELPDYFVIDDSDDIDWEATALNARLDYLAIEIDGVTYWYLSGELDGEDHVIPRIYEFEEDGLSYAEH